METTKNTTQKTPSPFCDALMDVTGGVEILADENDAAIVMCADGNTLNVRMKGRYDQHVNMFLNKMKVDIMFADMLIETVKNYLLSFTGQASIISINNQVASL